MFFSFGEVFTTVHYWMWGGSILEQKRVDRIAFFGGEKKVWVMVNWEH